MVNRTVGGGLYWFIYSALLCCVLQPDLPFDSRWTQGMQPIVRKLLAQEPVSKFEWQDLFAEGHAYCIWDEQQKNARILDSRLQEDILAHIELSSKAHSSAPPSCLLPPMTTLRPPKSDSLLTFTVHSLTHSVPHLRLVTLPSLSYFCSLPRFQYSFPLLHTFNLTYTLLIVCMCLLGFGSYKVSPI